MPLRRIVSLKLFAWPREAPPPPPDPVSIDTTYACAVERDDAVAPLARHRAPPTPCAKALAPAPATKPSAKAGPKKGTPPKKTPLVKQAKRYASRFFKPEMSRQPFVPDDFVIDRHCSAGRKLGRNLVDFAMEGSLVVNQNQKWFNKNFCWSFS